MQTVERNDLMLWCEGVYIKVDEVLGIIRVDEVACQRAVEALEKGETIALTEQGRIISTVVFENGRCKEIANV
jgi:hypothetical protein